MTAAAFAMLLAGAPAPVLTQAAAALAQKHLPEASAVAVRLARSTPAGEPPARSLLRLADALYQDLQFDGALAALQLSDRCEPISKGDQAQLQLRRGLLAMEAFDEAGARRTFQSALALDRTARLPEVAPPKTVHLLEELRSALPPPAPPPPVVLAVTAPGPAPAPPLGRWAWAPAAGGAAMGLAGGALYLLAKGNYDRLAAHDPSLATLDQVRATAEAGRLQQTWSMVLFGAGAAALGSAAVLALTGGGGATVRVGPSGVAVAGTFP